MTCPDVSCARPVDPVWLAPRVPGGPYVPHCGAECAARAALAVKTRIEHELRLRAPSF